MQFNMRHLVDKLVPAPGLEGVARSLVQVSFHCDTIGFVGIEIHDGVIIGDVLEILNCVTELTGVLNLNLQLFNGLQ